MLKLVKVFLLLLVMIVCTEEEHNILFTFSYSTIHKASGQTLAEIGMQLSDNSDFKI